MRKPIATLSALVALSLATAAFAHDADHQAMLRELLAANSVHGPVLAASEIKPTGVTRTFNVTAKQFEFQVSPSAFVANQGDTVVINLSVPGNDAAPDGHGMLMETYIEASQLEQVKKGTTKSFSFVATTPGDFSFVCTQSTCGAGHSSMFGRFHVDAQVTPPPLVSSVFPNSGTTVGGTSMVISGNSFQSGASVTFGGTAATGVNVTSSTSISATSPAHAAGTVDVTVKNPDDQIGSLPGAFTFVAPPPPVAVLSALPPSAPIAGGTVLTVNGSSLPTTGTATVSVGGTAATNVKLVTSGFLVATLPAHAAGTVDVVVTLGASTFTLSNAVTYIAPPPPRHRAVRH